MKELLKKLVAINSVSGNEKNILEFIRNELLENGVTVVQGKQWIAGKVSKGNTSKTNRCLILHGHVDTVSFEEAYWKTPPLELTVVNDKMYGLGVTDMKSGLAVMLHLTKQVMPNSFDIMYVFTANEEVDGSGAREFCEWFKDHSSAYQTIEAITLEPTDANTFSLGHRGNFAYAVSIKGQSGHGSRPDEITRPAINNAFVAIRSLLELKTQWQDKFANISIGSPTLNITSFSAGNPAVPNQFPDKATFVIDIRTNPELEPHLVKELNAALEKSGQQFTLTQLIHPSKAVSSSAEARLANICKKNGVTVANFSGATDLSSLAEIGISGIVYGPGGRNQMHIPNESIPIDAMNTAATTLQKILEEYEHA